MAGGGRDAGPSEDSRPLRLDLRRKPSTVSSAETIRISEPMRSGIPAEFPVVAASGAPLDRDAWSDDPASQLEAAHAFEPFASVDHPGLDVGRGSTRVHSRRARAEAGSSGAAGHTTGLASGIAAVDGGQSGRSDGVSRPSLGTDGPANSGAGSIASALEDRPPRAIEAPHPAYPATARRRNEQGSVVCGIHVSANGSVAHVVVLESSGVARLDRAAVETLELWSYEPALERGVPIASVVRQIVRFSLEGCERPPSARSHSDSRVAPQSSVRSHDVRGALRVGARPTAARPVRKRLRP